MNTKRTAVGQRIEGVLVEGPLTEKEAARCEHRERRMHRNGRSSFCFRCGEERWLETWASELPAAEA